MRFSKRITIIGIFMALIFAMFAIVPVSAADSSITLSPTTYIAPDEDGSPTAGEAGEVTVTVTDADENVATAVSNETLGGSTTTLNSGLSVTLFLDNPNVIAGTISIDNDSGTGQDESSALILEVALASSVQGRITITAGAANYTGSIKALTVDYSYASANTVTAKVTSTAGAAAGITIILNETGVNTGIFKQTFHVGAGSTAGSEDSAPTGSGGTGADGVITGKAGLQEGIVTVKYTDDDTSTDTATATITVEDTSPAVSGASPVKDARTTDLTPTLTGTITDTQSGVVESTIAIVMTASPDSGSDAAVGTLTKTAVSNGFSVTADLSGIDDNAAVTVTWHITAADAAGNTVASTAIAFVVDNVSPTFTSAETGVWWDTSKTGDDKTNTDASKAVNTSIAVTFSESLDAATVAASDFEVDDVAPSAATVNSGQKAIVFLTVPGLAAKATPKIELVGAVSDVAGNTVTSGTDAAATDGIAPAVTHTVSHRLSDGEVDVILNFSADEPVGTPTVKRNDGSSTTTLSGASGPQVVDVSANSYRVTDPKPADGSYTYEITVSDGTNSTVVGHLDPANTKAINYEVDDQVGAPTSIPADEGTVTQAEPLFVTVTYTAEGTDSGGANDNYPKVTVTKATLDGTDVLSSLSTDDNILQEFALTGVAVGVHELKVTGTDTAGNTLETEIDFTVTARGKYTVGLVAGWNLISFPADPDDTAIGTVFPSTHPATQVLTYASGEWQVAVRDGTSWSGTLTTIDSSHAYWVNTTSSVDVSTLLKLRGEGAVLLPTISVNTGWNLVPVVDLGQTAVGSSTANKDAWEHSAANYFTTISWKVAYSFQSGAWVRLTGSDACGASTGDAGCVANGLGYWVWATAAGTLVP